MGNIVSVEEALARGHRWITYPTWFIMFGIIGLCFYLAAEEIMPVWIVPSGFLISFILAWLYWSFMITRWRLWAFENVRNVHELKKRAIKEKLIWKDGSLFEKTEIRTAGDKSRFLNINAKFSQADFFIDELSIPDKTIIYYSKIKNLLELLVMIVCAGVGVYFIGVEDEHLFGFALILAGAYFGLKEYQEATNRKPQIVLDSHGIETISTKFNKWSNIRNEEVISERSGKYIRFYLVYDYPGGSEKLLIDDYATDQNTLEKLMRIYRGRSQKRIFPVNKSFK